MMLTRNTAIEQFLIASGFKGASRLTIAGDASFRHYARVALSGETRILMDAPPEKEDVRPFLAVAAHLEKKGYRVPRVLAADPEQGLLLLEDFGDGLYARLIASGLVEELELYLAAVDVLIAWRRDGVDTSTPLTEYSYDLLLREVALFSDWFLPEILPPVRSAEAGRAFMDLWETLLQVQSLQPQGFTHRDYHADNLFWLHEEVGMRRVGMLDFQDAVWGRSAYDLVSLLEDARRKVAPGVITVCLEHYRRATGIDETTLMQEYAFFGAQRNAKILGIFTRLFRRDGKPRYLSMIPHVWRLFRGDISHASLAPLAAWMNEYLTQADEERILFMSEHVLEGKRA